MRVKASNIIKKYQYSNILLQELVKTDFKLRYQASTLGYLWSVLKPLALFGVLYLVFGVFLPTGRGVPNFPVYLLLGVVLWNFFTEVTNGSVQAIVGRASLIRKIHFPKYVIILSTTISALINLTINLIIVSIFIAFAGISLSWSMLLLPLLLIELFLVALGLGFILSTLFVRYRDVNFIWEVIIQAAFYATPIIYPIFLIPDLAAKIIILNPVAQIIQDARFAVLSHDTSTIWTIYDNPVITFIPIVLSATIFITGAIFFRSRSPLFAEDV